MPRGDSEVQRALLPSQNHSSERDQTKGGQKWRAEQMSHSPGLAGVGYLGEDIQSLTPLWQLCALVRTAPGTALSPYSVDPLLNLPLNISLARIPLL